MSSGSMPGRRCMARTSGAAFIRFGLAPTTVTSFTRRGSGIRDAQAFLALPSDLRPVSREAGDGRSHQHARVTPALFREDEFRLPLEPPALPPAELEDPRLPEPRLARDLRRNLEAVRGQL